MKLNIESNVGPKISVYAAGMRDEMRSKNDTAEINLEGDFEVQWLEDGRIEIVLRGSEEIKMMAIALRFAAEELENL